MTLSLLNPPEAPTRGPRLPGGAPVKTLLAVASMALALGLWRHTLGPGKGIDPGIFPRTIAFNLLHHAPPRKPEHPFNGIEQPQQATAQPGAPEPISPFLIDDAAALDPFFAALHRLETPPAPAASPDPNSSSNANTSPAPDVVTILHYGDSPTTADLITSDVRTLLQARFGDAGDGYLLPARPWAWYGHHGTDLSDHDWTVLTAASKPREDTYGLGGARVEGGPDAGSRIGLKGSAQRTVEINFLAQPGGGTLAIKSGDTTLATIPTGADTKHPAWQAVELPPGTSSFSLQPASGTVALFGEDLRTGTPGVLYDSLGLNGAFTSVLSTGMNPAVWADELRHAAPALVVINYGTNESGFAPYVTKSYEGTLRTTIARLRAALPGVPILVMSPMDRGQRTGVNDIGTYATIPELVEIQRRVAAELHCAFFDTFNAMGGEGTMAEWYNGHPRLVAGDLIHPSPQGAAIVGKLFFDNLMLGYARWGKRQPPAPRPIQTAGKPSEPTARPAPEAQPSKASR